MSHRCYVIAEIGVNHDGSVERAKRMIEEAKASGADCAKFQTFRADALVTKAARKADYQVKTTGADESQRDMLRKLELAWDDYRVLKAHAEAVGIDFMSSPFDVESARLLFELGLRHIKIPSGEITNYPLLKYLGGLPAPTRLILSTGMSTLADIEAALGVLKATRGALDHVTVLHCNTEYPTPMEDVHLHAMDTIARAFGVSIGYSDHTDGIEIPIAAVALGATLIEKHFTLDRSLPGPDHKASLEPAAFASMVRCIRNIELARGSQIKQPSQSELANRPVARKSIVTALPVRKGEAFTETNLTTKRPGTGLSPMLWESIVGKLASRDYEADELVEG